MDKSPQNLGMDLWVEEKHGDFVSTKFRVRNVLFTEKTPFQKVEIVETEGHGKMLINDGFVMTCEADEFCYHEMITHVPLFSHPSPKRVLIIGGGDAGTLREVLRHPEIERCVMVEIDEAVVRACRAHLPWTPKALEDPRAVIKFEDGVRYVAETDEKFDIILVDSSEPIGPAVPLFDQEFYKTVATRLLDTQGIVVSQAESPFYKREVQQYLAKILREQFEIVKFYNYSNLTYPGGLWSFSFASKAIDPIRDYREQDCISKNLENRYYNPSVHRAAFAIPEFQRAFCSM